MSENETVNYNVRVERIGEELHLIIDPSVAPKVIGKSRYYAKFNDPNGEISGRPVKIALHIIDPVTKGGANSY
jgi:hypothetical protein